MASGDERHVKEPAAAEVDRFPDGMRVLAVDDDIVCLRLLEALLRHCKYKRERPHQSPSRPNPLDINCHMYDLFSLCWLQQRW
jgi:two-component response regulator (ARR-B family)